LKFQSRPNITNITLRVIYSCRGVFLTQPHSSHFAASPQDFRKHLCRQAPEYSSHLLSDYSLNKELQVAADFTSFYCVVSLALGFYVVLLKFAVLPGAILLQIQDNYHLRCQKAEQSSHIRSDCSVALFSRLFVSLSPVVLCQKECVVLYARELSHSQFIANSQRIHRQARGTSCCSCRVTQHHTASHGR
jgi:hypothetical protein